MTARLGGGICHPASSVRRLDQDNRRLAGLCLTRHPFGIYRQRYGNMNPFPIDYAFRPRLRGRLTLGRLPLPRKPSAFGGQVFHLSFRYSYRHPLFRHLQHASQRTFIGIRNAPLPRQVRQNLTPVTSVVGLSLGVLSAHDYSTSELLRTLSRHGCF